MTLAVALLPLFVAALALVVLRRTSRDASLITLFVTALVVIFFPTFHLSPARIGLAAGEGGATALTVAAILVPALLFYQVQQATGAIPVLERGMAKMIPDRDVQILLLVLGVGPAVEAMCGFGVGTVFIIPLLAALESDRLRVAQLSLLCQVIGPWGALGIGTSFAAAASGVRLDLLSMQSALLLAPVSICFSLFTLAIGGGREALARHWPCALGASCLQIGGMFLGSLFLGVELAGIVSGILVVGFLLFLGCNQWSVIWQTFITHHRASSGVSPLARALVPYLLLGTSLAMTRLFPAVSERLQTRGVLLFEPIHFHFAVLYSPGICLLFAAIAPFALFPLQTEALFRAVVCTVRQSFSSLIAVVGFLIVAALMQESGMTSSLGAAAATLGREYMWIAPVIGATSGWLTGSIMSGNALSVPMQMAASARVGLPLPWIIAAQNTSTAIASIVSPAHIILTVTAAGAAGQEGALLCKVGPLILWSVALIMVLLVWFLSQGLLVLGLLLALVNLPLVFTALRLREQGRSLGMSQTAPSASGQRLHLGGMFRLSGRLRMYGGLVLTYALYGTFAPVAKPVLAHLDPVVFFCLQMVFLVPFGLVLVARWRTLLDRSVLVRGGLFGICLSVAFLCLTLALKSTGISETTVFSCVNGVTAALVAWFILRQRIRLSTWIACLLAIAGAILVALTSSLRWQGNFTAFVGGSLLVVYAFLVEYLLADDLRRKTSVYWPILGVQIVVMAGVAALFALCSGDWQGVSTLQLPDLASMGYTSLIATLLPMILLTFLQRYVSAISIAFFAVLDPLLSAGLAFLGGERLGWLGYAGFGLVLASVMLQAVLGSRGASEATASKESESTLHSREDVGRNSDRRERDKEPLEETPFSAPLRSDGIGRSSRAILAYLAEAPHGLDLRALRNATGFSNAQLQHLLYALHRRGYVVMTAHHRYTLHPEYRPSVALLWCG
ncbi:hypothetical protein KDA_76230 [Dictyobacter alpinus]|uniref:L-lactate permease n=1 Tax=Dictyobacter alpinus TaxID=2014873 RepID=A0A402BLD6_9CHLR|nr:L-lactate permease [Dictyobacter alpinus]GCE32139.1 hypothetical protein KDA_76230 [Dictyobacter alpinus]